MKMLNSTLLLYAHPYLQCTKKEQIDVLISTNYEQVFPLFVYDAGHPLVTGSAVVIEL